MKSILSKLFPQAVKNWYHLVNAVLANVVYGFPSRKMVVIGVTGTNGKTTTTHMIGAILRAAGKKTAVASTIDFWINDERTVNESKFTTMNSWQLQKFLRQAEEAGCEYAVLETSSHALHQYRVWGVQYDIAVLTNITREHLDYHKTLERYRAAKRMLFRHIRKAVINADLEDVRGFIRSVEKNGGIVTLYSTKNAEADLCAGGIQLDFHKTEFRIEDELYHLYIPGLFNIENALAAIGVAKMLEIPYPVISKALAEIKGVPGRMEMVPNSQNVDIIIDYAVTPDAFKKLYGSILPLKIPGTKIIHVFGACGERDRGKRPILGEIAAQRADIIILTNEDPYHENGERILDEIEPGVARFKREEKDYFRIYDRRAAIKKALSLAEIGDIVLITGKGAETSMAIGDERISWSERQTIEEALQTL
jgi:UDP-N-acetylmuramoyl-L-alanyl-D-glutamate--2,6-diaminopimelate ligase